MTAAERRAARLRAERETLTAQIADTIADILDIRRQAGAESVKRRSGRPPTNLDTLRSTLSQLQQERAWLHSQWVAHRGDEVFTGGMAQLAALGIVVAPQVPKAPEPRERGAPTGARVATLLVWYVDYVTAYFADCGEPIKSLRERIALADKILSEKNRPAAQICAEYKKTRKLKPAHRCSNYATKRPSRESQYQKARRAKATP